jgi:hypothetical protein
MQVIQPNVFDCPGLSVSQDDGLPDKLGFGLMKLRKDRGSWLPAVWPSA